MAHTILKSSFVNLIAKRASLLETQSIQYTLCNGHKHYKPYFRKHRSLKNQLMPMYTDEAELPLQGPNSVHYNFRLHGRYWNEPRTVASHTYVLIDPYDPLKDKEQSWLNPTGAFEKLKAKRKDKKAIRDIQSFEEHFEIQDFMDSCEEIYIKANESIAEKDKDKMLDYLTPPAYQLALESTKNKRVHWKFLKNIDPAHPLRVRVAIPEGSMEDSFAQITVRFHTQQTLAIYDRYGRLMMGSEILAKDVLELVVFEKRISHIHGQWRVHQKILTPEGESAQSQLFRTKISEVIEAGVEEQKDIEVAVDEAPKAEVAGTATEDLTRTAKVGVNIDANVHK